MSTEINADVLVNRSGNFVKRSIPSLRMYSSVSISAPNTTLTLITFNQTDSNESIGSTGFTYNAGAFTNTTGSELLVHVQYGITYNAGSQSQSRLSWLYNDSNSSAGGRHGQMSNLGGSNEPSVSGSGIMKVLAGASIRLYVYQTTGSTVTITAMGYLSPYIHITVI